MEELVQAEVLVIGCGIAGGVAALRLADAGIPVHILTRAEKPEDSNTYHAQGGIIYKGKGDTPELLVEDIQRAGAGVCNPSAAIILANEGPRLIEKVLMERCGVEFDRAETGELLLALEGGHSIPRIVHTKDATGRTIALAVLKALQEHPKRPDASRTHGSGPLDDHPPVEKPARSGLRAAKVHRRVRA